MADIDSDSDRDTGISGGSEDVQRDSEPEILCGGPNRPTKNRRPREVLEYAIAESALNEETALFEVLPGIGKSYSMVTVADAMPVTVLTNLTDNYDEFEDWCERRGVGVERLPTRDLCLVLRDSDPSLPDDPIAQEAREARELGWSPSTIHREFDLQCQQGNETCPYREQIEKLDEAGRGLWVGYYAQGYNPKYLDNRVVAIDEDGFDAYVQEIKDPVKEAEEFIATLDYFPFEGIPYRPSDTELEEAIEILENQGLEPTDHRDTVGEFHAKAPLVAYALLTADRMENDWFVAELPGDRTATFYERPGKGPLHLLDPPDFSKAEAVIALDATPCISNWQRVLGEDFHHYRLFDDDGRNRYLRERGYEFIQLNSHVWPANGGNLSLNKCEPILREVYRKHGERPDLITSKAVFGEKEDIEGLKNRNLTHLWGDGLHYGGFRGKNDLSDSELLVVLGSPGRPDEHIQFQAALHGDCAEPAIEDGERLSGYDLDYQSDIANDILESTRRGGVFQAAMRAGRNDDAEATVYIATGMVPGWLETKKVGRRRLDGSFDACIRTRNENERKVIGMLQREDGISGREVARRTGLSKSTVLDALNRLSNEGLVEKRGRGRGSKWHSNGIESANMAGEADLGKMADIPYNDSIRASRPFSGPVIPRQERSVDPTDRYPDWIRGVQRRLKQRKLDEQLRQLQGGQL